MLVRSPRRFMLLAFLTFVTLFVVLQRSPWARESVYEQLPLFDSASRPNLSSIPGLNHDRIQAHLEDAWQHAIPAATPSALKVEEPIGEAEPNVPGIPDVASSPTESHPPWVTEPSRTEPVAPAFTRPANMKAYMQRMLKWSRPTWNGHWPPFQDYVDKAYDPNRWEQFHL